MKRLLLLGLAASLFLNLKSQDLWQHGSLKVTGNGHFLQYQDGTPFFWLGDTAWELFHRLDLTEINSYLSNRQSKGFNVIQAVVLAEFNGLTVPNRYGDLPLQNQDPTRPNEKYFQLVDSVVKIAWIKGMYMGLLPTWGDKVTKLWGAGPVIFNQDNAFAYGLWIGRRYKNYPNIIWILGGDRPAVKDSIDWRPIWRAMAKGILEGAGNKAFITYHPSGGDKSTSQYIHNENWLTMNMIQSGHGGGHDVPIWNLIQRDWNLFPIKPVLDAEPNYEDHPVNPWPTWDPKNGYYDDYDVRKQVYRSVFSGACGVTYGHHSVWQFRNPKDEAINHPKMFWTEALDRPGAFQVGKLRRLMESRPMLNRIPDQTIIKTGQGEKGDYMCAFRDSIGSFAMVYMPSGKTVTIDLSFLKSKSSKVIWFNPTTAKSLSSWTITNGDSQVFTPPSLGFGNDWVLIIDNPAFNYGNPEMKIKYPKD